MKSFNRRRLRNGALLAITTVVLSAWIEWNRRELGSPSFVSGYLLLTCLIFLTSLHWRKRLPGLPLGSLSTWMQAHIYVGLLTVPLFLQHITWRLPNGRLEMALAALYFGVTLSGLWGLYLSRTYPRRLTKASEQYLFETIPALRSRLSHQARTLVQRAVQQSGSTTLADHYTGALGAFFEVPASPWTIWFSGTQRRREILQHLTQLQRYLSDTEKSLGEHLFRLTRKKDELEYQYTLQLILRGWIFLHLALTYSLLALVTVHTAMVHAFAGESL